MHPPVYPQPPYLYLHDYFVSTLIPRLQALPYLDSNGTPRPLFEYVYPIVEKNEDSGVPQMFIGGNDYADLAPDDSVRSYCYFYLNNFIDIPNINSVFFNLSLFVWFNEKSFGKLRQRLQAYFATEIVSKALNDMQNIEIYTRPEDIFEYFEYDRFMPQTRPFNAIRIVFENRLGLPIDCIPTVQMPLIVC